MPSDINELDVNDIGLKGIFGDRFHDETESKPATAETKKVSVDITHTPKAEQKKTGKAVDALWEPIKPAPNQMDKLKSSAKATLVFGGLSILFFYWQTTGQMEMSASLPCICACCVLAGIGIGKNALGGGKN